MQFRSGHHLQALVQCWLFAAAVFHVSASRPRARPSQLDAHNVSALEANRESTTCGSGQICCRQENTHGYKRHVKPILHFCAARLDCGSVHPNLYARGETKAERRKNDLCDGNSEVALLHQDVCHGRTDVNNNAHVCCVEKGASEGYKCMEPEKCKSEYGKPGLVEIRRWIAESTDLQELLKENSTWQCGADLEDPPTFADPSHEEATEQASPPRSPRTPRTPRLPELSTEPLLHQRMQLPTSEENEEQETKCPDGPNLLGVTVPRICCETLGAHAVFYCEDTCHGALQVEGHKCLAQRACENSKAMGTTVGICCEETQDFGEGMPVKGQRHLCLAEFDCRDAGQAITNSSLGRAACRNGDDKWYKV